MLYIDLGSIWELSLVPPWNSATDILSVAAMTAQKEPGANVGPLALAPTLFSARSLQRATISSWGRCCSGRIEQTHNDRGASIGGSGEAPTATEPRTPRQKVTYAEAMVIVHELSIKTPCVEKADDL